MTDRSPSPPPADQVEAAQVLASCPFCGATGASIHPPPPIAHGFHDLVDRSPYYGHCDGCGADGPGADTDGEAAKLWNRRPVAALRPVAGVAPEGMRDRERVGKLLEGVGACAKCGSDHLYWRPGIPLSCAVCMTAVPDAILAALPPQPGATVR